MKKIAIEAALEAGKILRESLGTIKSGEVDHKRKFDYVTRVDRDSENLIIEIIKSNYPSHKILAEESLRDDKGGYRWIIDPLDGTTNYIHAYPVFAISIALEHNGEIVLGVIYDPTRNELFVAEKDRGATLNEQPIHVSTIHDPSISLLTTGFPFRSKEHIDLYLESFKRLFFKMSGVRRLGAVALDFAYLAAGRAEGFWEIGLAPWDVAAGYLIVQEAGGVMTDFAGGNEPIWTGNVVASNGLIHDQILKVVRDVFSGQIEK